MNKNYSKCHIHPYQNVVLVMSAFIVEVKEKDCFGSQSSQDVLSVHHVFPVLEYS